MATTSALTTPLSMSEEAHRVAYRVFGKDSAPHKMIFTMGLGGTTTAWDMQIRHFAAKPETFQFVVYDNRGMGFSDSVSGRWTTAKMARDALALLDRLGWRYNVHVVGLSMGGMISQEIVRQGKPNQFASLTLISTIAGGAYSLGLFVLSLPTGMQLAARTFLTTDPKTQLKNGLALLYPHKFLEAEGINPETGKPEKNFKIFRRLLIQRGLQSVQEGMPGMRVSSIFKQAFAVFSHNVTKEELSAISKSLNGHVKVITGDEDILVHPSNSVKLSEGLQCELITIKGAGHGANEQNCDEVNAVIEANVLAAAKRYATSTDSPDGTRPPSRNSSRGERIMSFAPVSAKL